MTEQTITRTEIADALIKAAALPRQTAATILDTVLELIQEGLYKDREVKLASFGTFYLRDKNERIGRNPKTGQEVPISPRRTISFRPSTILKNKIESIR